MPGVSKIASQVKLNLKHRSMWDMPDSSYAVKQAALGKIRETANAFVDRWDLDPSLPIGSRRPAGPVSLPDKYVGWIMSTEVLGPCSSDDHADFLRGCEVCARLVCPTANVPNLLRTAVVQRLPIDALWQALVSITSDVCGPEGSVVVEGLLTRGALTSHDPAASMNSPDHALWRPVHPHGLGFPDLLGRGIGAMTTYLSIGIFMWSGST